MHILHRILIVIVLIMAILVVCLDYFGFHGSILLNKVANGAAVDVIDVFWKLFQGPSAYTNFMFFAVISIELIVALLALCYKFIKG